MPFLDTIRNQYTSMLAPRPAKAVIEKPPDWLRATAFSEQYTIPERTLPMAQLELYQRLSWVQIAVSNKASIVATTQLNVMQLNGEEKQAVRNHPFELLLSKPNPLMSRYELMEALSSYLDITGNAYLWLNRANEKAQPDELWVLPAEGVKPVPNERMYIRGYTYEPEGSANPILLEPWEVVHFKRWHPLNRFVGLSAIESFATEAAGDMSMAKWNTNLFAKDNAKMPGALAFADPINDTDWRRMKADFIEDHGGVKRQMMALRGVGQGGVQWIQMAMSQRDMEFLAGRTFTKEQIFSIYSPGLASMLDVNATEANSTAGRKTFIELGVWPHVTRIAQKLTNDVMAAYGENVIVEPEDIRVTDKAMQLQEQAAFERVATVDEVREKHYQLEPLGDDRGNLLVTEVGKGFTRTTEPVDPLQFAPDGRPVQDGKPVGKVPDANVDGEKPEPGTQTSKDNPDEKNANKKSEVKAFRTWLKHRPKADWTQFQRTHLSEAEVKAVFAEMRGEGGADQDFFILRQAQDIALPDGRITPDALKAMILRLDRDDDEAEQKIRMAVERRTERALRQAFNEMMDTLFPEGWGQFVDPNAEAERIHRRWLEDQQLRDAVQRAVQDSADLGVSVAVSQFENIGFGFDYTLAHVAARDWALQYSGELISQIADTTRAGTRQAIARWVANGEPLQSLRDDLTPFFGAQRAELIAATEVTRSYAQGSRAAFQESKVVNKVEIQNARDERVCPICAPLGGKQVSLESGHPQFGFPPFHPRCRCWILPVAKEP